MKYFLFPIIALFAFVQLSTGQDEADETINEIIIKHGIDSSKVMEIASWVCDVYGPRMTGSPGLDRANDWAVETLENWGMQNVHLHEWGPFGKAWTLKHFEMHAESPQYWQVIAYPKAWSPSTGEVSGCLLYTSDAADD